MATMDPALFLCLDTLNIVPAMRATICAIRRYTAEFAIVTPRP